MASKKQQSEEIETLAERQENELQVLQSIYQDAVTDLRDQDAWKVSKPTLSWIIRCYYTATNVSASTAVDE